LRLKCQPKETFLIRKDNNNLCCQVVIWRARSRIFLKLARMWLSQACGRRNCCYSWIQFAGWKRRTGWQRALGTAELDFKVWTPTACTRPGCTVKAILCCTHEIKPHRCIVLDSFKWLTLVYVPALCRVVWVSRAVQSGQIGSVRRRFIIRAEIKIVSKSYFYSTYLLQNSYRSRTPRRRQSSNRALNIHTHPNKRCFFSER